MKKQIVLCFLVILAIFLISCNDSVHSETPDTPPEVLPEDTTEKVPQENTSIDESSDYATEFSTVVCEYPENPYEKIFVDLNAVAVEWGDIVADITYTERRNYDYEAREFPYVGVFVKYRKIYESTLAEKSPKQMFFTAPGRLRLLNKTWLSEGYDDIILIPEFYAEKIVKGEAAVLFLNQIGKIEKKDFYGVSYVYGKVADEYYESEYIGVFPCKDDKLDIDLADYGFPYHCLVDRLSDVSYMNSVFERLDKGYPLFETGTGIDELETYFDLVTKAETFAPLFVD